MTNDDVAAPERLAQQGGISTADPNVGPNRATSPAPAQLENGGKAHDAVGSVETRTPFLCRFVRHIGAENRFETSITEAGRETSDDR